MFNFNWIFKIIILLISIYIIYNILYIFYYKRKNQKYKIALKYGFILDKIKKSKYFNKLDYYIYELNKIDAKKYKVYTKTVILIFSSICSIISYILSYYIFDIHSTALLISIISFFIPYFVICHIYILKKQKIVENFPMYILTLKNYVYSTNDIIIAFRRANIPDYLSMYINKFNVSIEKGISVVQAFEELKNDINIGIISDFLSSLLTCHLNGGNVCVLLNKYAEIITKINLKNEKTKQENLSSILVFIILVFVNFFLLFTFVYGNAKYKEIMTTNLIGKTIINFNILSYIIIFMLYRKISKKI